MLVTPAGLHDLTAAELPLTEPDHEDGDEYEDDDGDDC
jgi:hypothetical protein